ncbi:MAG TPA: CHAT domain-containing protein [Vicinamibacterales bacterium]|jgi:CHAT domain-containing protein/Tfp pilus assembly protein PilF
MTRSALVAVVTAAAISAAACRTAPDSQQLFTAATDALWRGQMADARALTDRGIDQTKARPGSVWSWKFHLLRAEILLVSGDRAAATELLASQAPSAAEFGWVAAKQKYLQGQLQIAQGQPAAAMTTLADARALAKSTAASDVALDTEVLVGQALFRQGRWADAERTLQDLVARATEAGDDYRKAVALVNLGMGRLVRNRFDEALPFFETVISLDRLMPQLVHVRALINAGLCYARLGDIDRAIAVLERAVKANEQRGAALYLEQSLGELGDTYLVDQRFAEGIPHLQRALMLAKEQHLDSDAAVWAGNLAQAHLALQQWDRAEALNAEARALRSDQRNAPYLVLNDGKIAEGRGQLATAARLFQQALLDGGNDPAVRWPAYAGLGRVDIASGRIADGLRHFETALATVEQSRADLQRTDYRLSIQSRQIDLYHRYVDQLLDQGRFERALEIADSSRARVLAERQGVEGPGRSHAQAFRATASRLGASLVFYWLGLDHSSVWVVDGSSIRHRRVSATARDLEALVRAHQKQIVESIGDPLASTSGDDLYKALIAPIAPMLSKRGSVVIVPDGPLNMLNFETLSVPGERRHYWIEDVAVSVAPSLASLSTSTASIAPHDRSLLLIGDAVPADARYPVLKHASTEMAAIANAFSGRAVVYRGDLATPARYLASEPGGFEIVHFTAHADANTESPLDSAVILSKDQTSYKLYARDVAEHPLNAALVTISACRSAGERTYAGEGLVGFAWAFLRAGAKRVIAGLWDVDDRSTAELMGGVYKELAGGKSPAAALREAKLAMIKAGGPASKPYYWGPFQLFVGSEVIP